MVDAVTAWAAHFVEHNAGTTAMVSMGATGATSGDATMEVAGAGVSASPADAVGSTVASELAVTGAKKQSEVRSIDW